LASAGQPNNNFTCVALYATASHVLEVKSGGIKAGVKIAF